MPRLPNWQLKQILPALVFVARTSAVPNQAMEETIAELVALAQRRGMHSFLASLEHDAARAQAAMAVAAGAMPKNGNGPAEADPSPTAHAPGEKPSG